MIDTVALTLNQEEYRIFDHKRFDPSTASLFFPPYIELGSRGNFQAYQNPTKEDFLNGIYKPRLTITKRCSRGGFPITLRIEFSAPKLLYNNNFDELREVDFQSIIDRLHMRLGEMGVTTTKDTLINAHVSTIHYSKNVFLQNYETPYSILKELKKIDVNKHLDINQTDYRNEGHSLRFRCKSHEFILYDKLKDLKKAHTSEANAIENDNAIQLSLFDNLNLPKPFEVLRLECRLNNARAIQNRLTLLGFANDLTFKSLYNKSIAQSVLLNHWKMVTKNYLPILHPMDDPGKYFQELIILNQGMKLRKALQIYGLKKLLDEMGIREFREITHGYSNKSWYDLKAELDVLTYPSQISEPFGNIEISLENFETVRLDDVIDYEK